MHIVYPAIVSALLFSIGVYGVLARRNTILVLMSVELMLNAVNLNLVAFDVWLADRLHSGQVLTLFVIVIAAAEVGLGLAIVLALYRNRRTVDIDHLRDLAEPSPNGLAPASANVPSSPPLALAGGHEDPPTGRPNDQAPASEQAQTKDGHTEDAHTEDGHMQDAHAEDGRAESGRTQGGRKGEQPVKRGGTP